MTSKDEKALVNVALAGMCAAPFCGVALAVGAIADIHWLAALGGTGLIVVALLGPALLFAALCEAVSNG
jgi:hypothetical protein